jgi:hypothetical protein
MIQNTRITPVGAPGHKILKLPYNICSYFCCIVGRFVIYCNMWCFYVIYKSNFSFCCSDPLCSAIVRGISVGRFSWRHQVFLRMKSEQLFHYSRRFNKNLYTCNWANLGCNFCAFNCKCSISECNLCSFNASVL